MICGTRGSPILWVIRATVVFSLLLVDLASMAGARPLAEVQASGSLRVAVYWDFPPFADGPRQNPRGLDVDLAAAIAKRLGVKVEYMVLTAGNDVNADLRNAIWRGPVVGGAVADLMLHVPVDPRLASRNDKVVIFAPYYTERLAVVTDPEQTGGDTLLDAFENRKVAVEGDSLSDSYLMGAFGGRLRENVVHHLSIDEAVAALQRGEVAGVMAQRSEIEGALKEHRGKYRIVQMPTPGLFVSSWRPGMAVKEDAHDLADALEPIVDTMIRDGTLAALFAKYGLTYTPPHE
ncbi:MAG: transporter substrate-binding domain-containing protein [Rhodomicrobium sp.]